MFLETNSSSSSSSRGVIARDPNTRGGMGCGTFETSSSAERRLCTVCIVVIVMVR